MDFVSRIRHSVTLWESLVSKAVVTTNAHGQLQDSSTNHLALSVVHLDNSPRLHPPNYAQAHLQAQLDYLESPSYVHPCAQVVTSPGLNTLCQMHPPAQMDSSHGTSSPVHLPGLWDWASPNRLFKCWVCETCRTGKLTGSCIWLHWHEDWWVAPSFLQPWLISSPFPVTWVFCLSLMKMWKFQNSVASITHSYSCLFG